jgi:hypothetical protein
VQAWGDLAKRVACHVDTGGRVLPLSAREARKLRATLVAKKNKSDKSCSSKAKLMYHFVRMQLIDMNDHTTMTAPHPVRSAKLSIVWPG